MNEVFAEIGTLVIVATFFALVARLLRQPPLIGYLIAGLILGPLGAKSLHNPELLEAMRGIGIAFVLFLVGLELNWKKALKQIRTASGVAIIQVVASFATALSIAYLFNLPVLSAFYVGLSLAFASTVIVVKILSEARELNTLHGQLSVSLLFAQDVIAVFALVFAGGLYSVTNSNWLWLIFLLVLKTACILLLIWVLAAHILPPLFERIAKSSELLFLCSIAWCFIFSISMGLVGFPIEIAALLAGISLASLPYNLEILSRLRSIRDFFVILLFVGLGSSITAPSGSYLVLSIALIFIVSFLKPFISYVTLSFGGYTSRTAFMTALTQGQLSEFSLPIVAIAVMHNQVSTPIAGSITLTAATSLFISTLLLTHRQNLYNYLRPLLQTLERVTPHSRKASREPAVISRENHLIIFGYHRMGFHILKLLKDLPHPITIVDSNPEIVIGLKEEGYDALYGDAQDHELLDKLELNKARFLISTIPHVEETLFLLEETSHFKNKLVRIVTSHTIEYALNYYDSGADYVVLPHMLGGEHIAELISQFDHDRFKALSKMRSEEITLLKKNKHSLYFD